MRITCFFSPTSTLYTLLTLVRTQRLVPSMLFLQWKISAHKVSCQVESVANSNSVAGYSEHCNTGIAVRNGGDGNQTNCRRDCHKCGRSCGRNIEQTTRKYLPYH